MCPEQQPARFLWLGAASPWRCRLIRPASLASSHLKLHRRDFLLLCFERQPKDRPNAARLLQHPFVVNATSYQPPGQLVPNPVPGTNGFHRPGAAVSVIPETSGDISPLNQSPLTVQQQKASLRYVAARAQPSPARTCESFAPRANLCAPRWLRRLATGIRHASPPDRRPHLSAPSSPPQGPNAEADNFGAPDALHRPLAAHPEHHHRGGAASPSLSVASLDSYKYNPMEEPSWLGRPLGDAAADVYALNASGNDPFHPLHGHSHHPGGAPGPRGSGGVSRNGEGFAVAGLQRSIPVEEGQLLDYVRHRAEAMPTASSFQASNYVRRRRAVESGETR